MLRHLSATRSPDSDGPVFTCDEYETCPDSVEMAPGRVHWFDFDQLGQPEARLLATQFRFHPLAIEDAVEQAQYPKADDYGDYLYLTLHAIDDHAADPEAVDTVELDMFLGRDFLITGRDGRPLDEFDALRRDIKKRPAILGRGPDLLLHSLLDRIVVDYFPRLEGIEERLDQLETDALAGGAGEVLPGKVLALRRQLLRLKRIIHPQRELFLRLARPEFCSVIDHQARLYFRDTYDQIYRVSEMLDGERDMLQGIFEAHYTLVSYRLNDIVRVLTMVTTLLMPMTVVTGVYGMNFEAMPGLKSPLGFWLAMAAMGGVSLFMLMLFRRMGWIGGLSSLRGRMRI